MKHFILPLFALAATLFLSGCAVVTTTAVVATTTVGMAATAGSVAVSGVSAVAGVGASAVKAGVGAATSSKPKENAQ